MKDRKNRKRVTNNDNVRNKWKKEIKIEGFLKIKLERKKEWFTWLLKISNFRCQHRVSKKTIERRKDRGRERKKEIKKERSKERKQERKKERLTERGNFHSVLTAQQIRL